MFSATLISLRETLETSLIVGILLTLLTRLGRKREQRYVWMGVGCGGAVSIAVAVIFQSFSTHLTDEAKEIYEGCMMLSAAVLLTWMILWMMRMGRSMRASLERDLTAYASNDQYLGIFLLSFTSMAREGTEMVLFLHAAFLSAKSNIHHLTGVLAGITGALLLAVLLFRGSRQLPLRTFFTSTALLLLFVGAGLVSHGIGALQEAHLVTVLQSHAWNMSTILPEEGAIGGMLESLFGYSDHPTVLQLVSYLGYLIGAMVAWRRTKQG